MPTEAAAFAGYRVNLKIFNGFKVAHILAQVTLGTLALINKGNLPASEFVLFLDGRLEQ